MSYLFLDSGAVFGPFRSISTLGDRLVCDGVEYPLSVIGGYLVSNTGPADGPAVVPDGPAVVPDEEGMG